MQAASKVTSLPLSLFAVLTWTENLFIESFSMCDRDCFVQI